MKIYPTILTLLFIVLCVSGCGGHVTGDLEKKWGQANNTLTQQSRRIINVKKKQGQANNTLTQQIRRIIHVNKKTISISEGESKRGNDHGPNISNGGFRVLGGKLS